MPWEHALLLPSRRHRQLFDEDLVCRKTMRYRDRPHRLQHLRRAADVDVRLLAPLVKQLGEGIGRGADETFPGALRMPDTDDDPQFRESGLQILDAIGREQLRPRG